MFVSRLDYTHVKHSVVEYLYSIKIFEVVVVGIWRTPSYTMSNYTCNTPFSRTRRCFSITFKHR